MYFFETLINRIWIKIFMKFLFIEYNANFNNWYKNHIKKVEKAYKKLFGNIPDKSQIKQF